MQTWNDEAAQEVDLRALEANKRGRAVLRALVVNERGGWKTVGSHLPLLPSPPTSLKVLGEIDEKLAVDDDNSAFLLFKDLQGKDGGFRCFGAAPQVLPRLYSLDELKQNGIDIASLLSPLDITLGAI